MYILIQDDQQVYILFQDDQHVYILFQDNQHVQILFRDDQRLSDMTKALVLSLGVCYRACLRSKEAYDRHIVAHFQPPFTLPNGPDLFACIIDR